MRSCILCMFCLMWAAVAVRAQNTTISGKVTGSDGVPLIGVSVQVKVQVRGATIGTQTDLEGNYRLAVPMAAEILVFSYLGYETAQETIDGRTFINVTLSEDTETLTEVVIIGYSERAQLKQTSSLSEVGAERIENIPLSDANQLLQGRAPGLISTVGSGQPGALADVRIRGTGSFDAGRGPLYVVDGVIVVSGDFTNQTTTNDILANLNPNDIASINVLKDATATALYGSRGANGVIVINTKEGQAGRTQIKATAQYGVTKRNTVNSFDVLNSDELIAYEHGILAASGFSAEQIETERPSSLADNFYNWLDAAYRTGQTENYMLSASGGNEKTRFYIGGGYYNQEGIVMESGFKRYSMVLNLDHNANDKLQFSSNLNLSYADQLTASPGNQFNSPILGGISTVPYQLPVNPETGELYVGTESDWLGFTADNFVRTTPLNSTVNQNFRGIGNVTGRYQFIPELSLRQSLFVDYIDINEDSYTDPTTPDGIPTAGRASKNTTDLLSLTSQTFLNFNKTIESDHNIDGFLGFEYQNVREENFAAGGTGFATGYLKTLNSAAVPESVGGQNIEYAFVSVLGNLNYNYDYRYFLTGSLRRDGSSRFGANNRYAMFYAVGGSWQINNESFAEDQDWLSNARLRVSYGTSGNADIAEFSSLGLYSFEAYNGIPASLPSQVANPDLRWEKTAQLDIGADLGLFERINLTADYFNRESIDLLQNRPIPATSGFTTITENIGKLKNTGVEIGLNTNNLVGEFKWNTNFQITFQHNEMTELFQGQPVTGTLTRTEVGQPIESFYLRKYAGADPETGLPRWVDGEGGFTSDYSQAPRFFAGNFAPDVYGGFENVFSYQGVSLSAFIYFTQGNEIYNDTRRIMDSDGAFFGLNQFASTIEDRWQRPGDQAWRPQALLGGNSSANQASTRYLENGSYLRLRTVSLSYTFPQHILTDLRVSGLKIFVSGTNLWTLTDYDGFDPELAVDGIEFFRYPNGKSLTFGIELGL